MDDLFKLAQAMAFKEIEMCEHSEGLHAIQKRWTAYFNQLNKFVAGHREEVPYFDENGKVI